MTFLFRYNCCLCLIIIQSRFIQHMYVRDAAVLYILLQVCNLTWVTLEIHHFMLRHLYHTIFSFIPILFKVVKWFVPFSFKRTSFFTFPIRCLSPTCCQYLDDLSSKLKYEAQGFLGILRIFKVSW